MIYDMDQVLGTVARFQEMLVQIVQLRQQGQTAQADLMIDDAFKIDVGISEMMASFMSAEEIVEFINRTGNNWPKIALCAHLLMLTSEDRQKAQTLLDTCVENIEDEFKEHALFKLSE